MNQYYLPRYLSPVDRAVNRRLLSICSYIFGQPVCTQKKPMRKTTLGIMLLVSAVAACGKTSTGSDREALPATIQQCETGVEFHCGTWTLVSAADSLYNGVWDQGTRATLTMERFDRDSVVVRRVDIAGPSVGITGVYRGKRASRDGAEGSVLWTNGFQTFGGTWTAEW